MNVKHHDLSLVLFFVAKKYYLVPKDKKGEKFYMLVLNQEKFMQGFLKIKKASVHRMEEMLENLPEEKKEQARRLVPMLLRIFSAENESDIKDISLDNIIQCIDVVPFFEKFTDVTYYDDYYYKISKHIQDVKSLRAIKRRIL